MPHLTPLFCDRCARPLRPGRGEFFAVRIDAVADPSPPSFDPEDLARDLGPEIERALRALEGTTAQEAADQVHRRVALTLCNACFAGWIEDPVGWSSRA